MTNVAERDESIEKMLLLAWRDAGTPAKDIEVWPIPRPTGGMGLCVNFLPMDNNQSESMIQTVISNLVESGVVKRFSGLQFAVSKPLSDPTRNMVVARYFLEDDRLRFIERDPSSIRKNPLDALVTTKITLPSPVKC
ncbi:MAG TPA: hypothetical protein P5527_04800 [Kiritimatiellia bacterium]|nr:hypothetical protein [Kiritimatiellia bacterium]